MEPILKRGLCDVAREVNRLLGAANALDVFAQRIAEAAGEQKRRHDVWEEQATEDAEAISECPSLPVPVPRGKQNREISLAEKYAVLAAVHVAFGANSEPLVFYPGDDKDVSVGEPLAGAYLWVLVQALSGNPNYRPLDSTDADEIGGWVADVEQDLCGAKPAAHTKATEAVDRWHETIMNVTRLFIDDVADSLIEKVAGVAKDTTATVHERLTRIGALMPIPSTASSRGLGKLLGVSHNAVQLTDWWKSNRKGDRDAKAGRREAHLRSRGKVEKHGEVWTPDLDTCDDGDD